MSQVCGPRENRGLTQQSASTTDRLGPANMLLVEPTVCRTFK